MNLLRTIRDAIRRCLQRRVMPLTVAEAQRRRVCRICKLNDNPAPGNPLVLNYGEEYAHEQCLKRHNIPS
jgi:hypothetical protein